MLMSEMDGGTIMTQTFYGQSCQSASCMGERMACGFVHRHAGEPKKAETHDGIIVHWVFRGSGSFTQNGESYPIREETLCLRRPGHRYRMQLDANMQHARYFLKIPESAYPLLCELCPGFDDLPPVRQMPYQEALVDSLWSLLYAMQDTPDTHAHLLLPAAMQLLLALCAPQEPLEPEDPMVEACKLLTNVEYSDASLPDIAGQLNLSYHAFRKQFTLRFGMSPGKYRLNKRMSQAKQALDWGESISEVTERLGFSDVYAFSKQFRAMTGKTPGYYRTHQLV